MTNVPKNVFSIILDYISIYSHDGSTYPGGAHILSRMMALLDVFTHLPDVTSDEREVCTHYTSALCSPSRLSLGTALVRRGFITKDTSV